MRSAGPRAFLNEKSVGSFRRGQFRVDGILSRTLYSLTSLNFFHICGGDVCLGVHYSFVCFQYHSFSLSSLITHSILFYYFPTY